MEVMLRQLDSASGQALRHQVLTCLAPWMRNLTFAPRWEGAPRLTWPGAAARRAGAASNARAQAAGASSCCATCGTSRGSTARRCRPRWRRCGRPRRPTRATSCPCWTTSSPSARRARRPAPRRARAPGRAAPLHLPRVPLAKGRARPRPQELLTQYLEVSKRIALYLARTSAQQTADHLAYEIAQLVHAPGEPPPPAAEPYAFVDERPPAPRRDSPAPAAGGPGRPHHARSASNPATASARPLF